MDAVSIRPDDDRPKRGYSTQPEEFLEEVSSTISDYPLDTQNSFVSALKTRLIQNRSDLVKKLREEALSTGNEADRVEEHIRELARI